jgi:hypothetical protein
VFDAVSLHCLPSYQRCRNGVSPVNAAFFEEYRELKDSGRRPEATAALAKFISSFAGMEEKTVWTRWYLESEQIGLKIRHELFEQVILPVLVEGYQRRDPWALRWLARTTQNLQHSKDLCGEIEFKTGWAFLKDLVAMCPEDDDARTELLGCHVGWFRHCVHEWPTGILYGMDGATVGECDEILAAVAESRHLDRDHKHAAFLDDFETKVIQYKARIAEFAPDNRT